MIFVTIKPRAEKSYTPDDLDKLAEKWRDLLYTGGIKSSFYVIDASKLELLCSLQKGWDGDQVKNFVLEQPEVEKITWDNHIYTPKSGEL